MAAIPAQGFATYYSVFSSDRATAFNSKTQPKWSLFGLAFSKYTKVQDTRISAICGTTSKLNQNLIADNYFPIEMSSLQAGKGPIIAQQFVFRTGIIQVQVHENS